MKISIVILHFGELITTQKCIRSLKRYETEKFSLIVVNNTLLSLSKNDFPTLPDIAVINSGENLGFAGGVNKGIQYAMYKKSEAVLLLNNDTSIAKPILKVLSGHLQKNVLGIVAPAIEFEKEKRKTYDLGGNVIMPFGKTYHTEVSTINNMIRNVDYVSGCCMLIKKNVFQKIGMFDTRFFLYYEDVDFCLRAKSKGFEVDVVPSVSIYHELSKSAGKLSTLSIYHQLKSGLLFGRKYSKGVSGRFLNVCFIFLQTLLFLKARPSSTIKALSAWKVAF